MGNPVGRANLFKELRGFRDSANCSAHLVSAVTHGPIITRQALEEIRESVGHAIEHGATVAVYMNSQGRCWRVAEAIECGMGVVKESDQGREGLYYGIDEYVETKFVCLDNLNA